MNEIVPRQPLFWLDKLAEKLPSAAEQGQTVRRIIARSHRGAEIESLIKSAV